jgi:protein-tyrosine phosphatase
MLDRDDRRALPVDGLYNARDLGGLRRLDGSRTPFGVFFRSENLSAVTPIGWQQLAECGVRTVIDLRGPNEDSAYPTTYPDRLTRICVDLDGLSNSDFWAEYRADGRFGTALYYLPHLTAMPMRMGAVLQGIADAPTGGVLFHCMGGRDRTGMVAMVLLAAAQVRPEEILDDYLATVGSAQLLAQTTGRSNAEPAIEELCRSFGSSTAGAFTDALAGLDLKELFTGAGLSADTVAQIRSWRGQLPAAGR